MSGSDEEQQVGSELVLQSRYLTASLLHPFEGVVSPSQKKNGDSKVRPQLASRFCHTLKVRCVLSGKRVSTGIGSGIESLLVHVAHERLERAPIALKPVGPEIFGHKVHGLVGVLDQER